MLDKSLIKEQTCRACTKTDPVLVSLFDKQINPEGISYSQMITECTMYPIQEDDDLPQLICSGCTEKVKIAYAFKKQFEESQSKLLSLLDSTKVFPIEPIEAIFNQCTNEESNTTKEALSPNKRRSNRSSISIRKDLTKKEEPCKVLNIPTGEKLRENKCPTCFRTFIHLGHLKNHIKKYHKGTTSQLEATDKIVVTCDKTEFIVEAFKHIDSAPKLGSERENDAFDVGTDDAVEVIDVPDTESIASVKAEIEVSEELIDGIAITETNKEEENPEDTNILIEAQFIDPERRYRCATCYKAFKRKSHLKQHMLCHTKAKPYECTICQKKFSRKDNLYVHMGNHGKRLFDCDICKRSFGQAYLLKRHKEQTHSNEKSFLCSECGQRFVRKGDLAVHMRRHTGEKPFKCQYCNKGFTRSTEVYVHERYHTGEKKHVCNICDKAFQRPYNLLVHMRTHTGERPYKCPHCPKNFAQCSDLKAHIRRHTGERYRCDQCSMGFIHGFVLNQHKNKVHGVDVPKTKIRVAKIEQPSNLNTSEVVDNPC